MRIVGENATEVERIISKLGVMAGETVMDTKQHLRNGKPKPNAITSNSTLRYQPPAQFAAATIAAMVPAASAPATPALQQHTRGQEALPIPQPLLS
jgi:hypothetical protein